MFRLGAHRICHATGSHGRRIRCPQVDGCQLLAASRADVLALPIPGQVTQELNDRRGAVDDTTPSPPVVVGRCELEPSEGLLNSAEIRIGVDLGDQQDVDVGGAEVLGDDALLLLGEDLGHKSSEDHEKRVVVAQLPDEADGCPRLVAEWPASARPYPSVACCESCVWRGSISSRLTCAAASCPRAPNPSRSAYRRGGLTTGMPR